MPLSPQDRTYWTNKLGWKTLLYLWLATVLMGAVVYPAFLFTSDYMAGQGKYWSLPRFLDLGITGLMLGTVVSCLMYTIARFYLYMGWLPARR